MPIVLGAIADDFTGATDLANTLVKEGMRVVQVIGVPEPDIDFGDADAVVVALKSRTAPVADAITESLQALAWLRAQGAGDDEARTRSSLPYRRPYPVQGGAFREPPTRYGLHRVRQQVGGPGAEER